jgi:hypothetical protein
LPRSLNSTTAHPTNQETGFQRAPHGRKRALLTLITAELASQQLETWGITPPREPLEQIATYLDHRDTHNPERRCVVCGTPLSGRQRSYCSDASRPSDHDEQQSDRDDQPASAPARKKPS